MMSIPLGVGQTTGGRGARDQHESSMDMSSILSSVMNDVLKDPQDQEQALSMGGPRSESVTLPLSMGGDLPTHPNVLTVPLGSDGFMPSMQIISSPPTLALGPSGGGSVEEQDSLSVQSSPPSSSSFHLKSPGQMPGDGGHLSFPREYNFPPYHLPSSAEQTTSGSLPGSRKTTPPSSLNPIQPPISFDDDELDPCEKHPEEKLAYFCPECAVLACKSCAGSDHAQHKFLGLREAFVLFRPSLKELLNKTQVVLELLECSLADTKKMNSSVCEKQQEALSEVQEIFQAHREAVAKREQEVINQINEIASKRTSSLAKDEETIRKVMESVRSLSKSGEATLSEGSQGQMLVAHYKLDSQLQSCRSYTSSWAPSEDSSFVLKSKSSLAQSALDSLCLLTTAPYPPLCVAMGEGLYYPKVNKLCTVILAAKDRAGEPCLEGGERLFVQLKPVGGGGNLPIDIRDHTDGSYSISFRPQSKGEHQLVIAIRGQLIQGSPFTLFVDGGREYGRFGVLTQVFGSEGSGNGQFCRPWGICCDQHGNILVGDRSNHRVQVFDINGNFKHKFGSEGVRPGQFNRPAGVAITREGHVVVADKDNHRIQVLKIDGTFLFMFGSKGGNDGQMIYPYDVAVNQLDGRIAVTDTGNHRLLIFSHDGILLGKFGYKGYLCGHFDSPRGIAFNDEGNIIVSDFNVHHILVIHTEGTTARILGSQGSGNGQFMRPQGIAVDHMSNFVITDTRNNRIVIMHPSGHFVAKFGVAGSAPGQFDRPTSVCVLPDGRVAVVDFGNSRVQIFNNCKVNPAKQRPLPAE